MRFSNLVEDECYPSHEPIAGRFLGIDGDELDGKRDVERTQDEAAGLELRIADSEVRAVADGVEVGAIGAVGEQRIVVPVDEHEGLRQDQGLHGQGVCRGNANGDKALPGTAHRCRPGTDGLERSGRQMQHQLNGRRADDWLEKSRSVRNHRDRAGVLIFLPESFLRQRRQQIGDGESLRGQDTVYGLKRKLTAAAQEIRKMGLPKAGLAGEQRDAECAPLDPAQQFQAESLVHLAEIHLWKVRRQQ